MYFETPIVFLFLPVLAAILLFRHKGNNEAGISASDDTAIRLTGKSKQWKYKIPFLLQVLSALVLVVALARPITVNTKTEKKSKGIAIQMVVDVSSSMDQGVEIADSMATRMEVAKRVMKSFIAGNDSTFQGREHDVIGIISFARFANTICPFTLGSDVLVHFVEKLEIEERPNEDGTAYGDATALAAARLHKMDGLNEENNGATGETAEVKSKIIILLTDGENNCGRFQPMAAAALAEKWGIRIYTISLQDDIEVEEIERNGQQVLMPSELSETDLVLQQMSAQSNGKFWRAHDFESLNKVYKEIDDLETSEIKTISVIEEKEIFHVFALLAFFMLVLEIIFRNTWLRKIP